MKRSNLEALYIKGSDIECWNWVGCKTHNGYGQLTKDQQHWVAHRYFYTVSVGPIPDGMLVCHKCDNRACVNPKHLFLGTAQDNTNDMMRKGRHESPKKELCHEGHPLSGDNLYVSPKGKRGCKECQRWRCVKYELNRRRSA